MLVGLRGIGRSTTDQRAASWKLARTLMMSTSKVRRLRPWLSSQLLSSRCVRLGVRITASASLSAVGTVTRVASGNLNFNGPVRRGDALSIVHGEAPQAPPEGTTSKLLQVCLNADPEIPELGPRWTVLMNPTPTKMTWGSLEFVQPQSPAGSPLSF